MKFKGLILVMLLFSSVINAQHKLRTNILAVLYGNPGFAYEYLLGNNFSIGVENSFRLFYWEDIDYYSRSGIRVTPEIRKFIGPYKNKTHINMYLGLYYQYKREWEGSAIYGEYDEITHTQPVTYTRFIMEHQAVGMKLGLEYMAESGFFINYYIGAGPHVWNYLSHKSKSSGDVIRRTNNLKYDWIELNRFNIRFGFALGWRFGSL